jgi:hypothetical protein
VLGGQQDQMLERLDGVIISPSNHQVKTKTFATEHTEDTEKINIWSVNAQILWSGSIAVGLLSGVNIMTVIPANDCRDAGGRAMHGAIAEAGMTVMITSMQCEFTSRRKTYWY